MHIDTVRKPKGMFYSKNAIYAVYKGEEHLTTGTAEECAEELGVSSAYIFWMVTPTGKKRLANRKNPEKAMTADVIDWEEVD